MTKSSIWFMCFVLIASVPSGFSTTHAWAAARSSNVLVDSAWLKQHANDPDVRILDVSQTKERYANGHIPGSLFVDWITDITDPAHRERYNVVPEKMMQTLLCKLGVSKKTTIVLYDDLDNRLSTRMFWTLRYYGHDDIRILNGGRKAWERAHGEFVSDVPAFEATNYRIGKVNARCRTNMTFIKAHLADPQTILVDGRPASQYSGEKPGKVYHTGKEHVRKGHIPGALNIVWKENFKQDGTFKSVEELRKLYEGHGVTRNKTIVTYCNEGLHAAPPWFVLTELLGYSDVYLYDDSMAQWANAPDALIVTGTKP